MNEEASQVEEYNQTTRRVRRRATQIFLVVLLIAAAVVLPPFINISRHQREITALMTRSLGRPVRLSSVNLQLLPRPGFLLNNLSVGEAPEFGVEPILSAETVVASIRLSALLTGKVEVDRISLDNASLNLVQTTPGRWNIDEIMTGNLVQGMTRTAPTAPQPVFRSQPAAFPYLEAKNSRVNVKHGLEKLPYSLTDAQISFWQESPGVWRLRLRGQPARTDTDFSSADTGDLRLEATLQTLPGHNLYQMPLKVQVAWREAQLGQLSRLLLGSDQGWRGNVTADLNLQGTLDNAQTEARLRATGVRREEFVPATSMDFDIHCGLLYQHTARALHNVDCTTGIGDGKLALQANLPSATGQPEATLTVDSMPLQAGLDMLRTVRSGFAPNLSADGKVSGQIRLSASAPAPAVFAKPGRHNLPSGHIGKNNPTAKEKQDGGAPQGALQGELTIVDGALHGGALTHPLTLPKMTLAAMQLPGAKPSSDPIQALGTRFSVSLAQSSENKAEAAPAGHAQELAVRLQLLAAGYQADVTGSAPPERLRELAYALGVSHSQALDALSGGQADADAIATGPWVAAPEMTLASPAPASASASASAKANSAALRPSSTISASSSLKPAGAAGGKSSPGPAPMPLPGPTDALVGAVRLHRVSWSVPYLANAVVFPEATVNFAGDTTSASSTFTYGALSGTVAVNHLGGCAGIDCQPQVEIHLADADAATIEGALLGAPEKKSMLSPLIDRVRNSQHTAWPEASVKFAAETLVLGPVTLHKPLLQLKLTGRELTLESWQANLLGGDAKGTGSCVWNGNQLAYSLEGSFNNLSGAQLGQLLDHPAAAPSVKAAAASQEGADKEPAKDQADKEQANKAQANKEQANLDKQDAEAAPASSMASFAASAALWTGGPVDGSGKVELSGLTAKELASSATGTLHFHWAKGTIPVSVSAAAPAATQASTKAIAAPPARAAVSTATFTSWTGDAAIGSSRITLGSNSLTGLPHEKATSSIAGNIPFGGPAQLTKAAKPLQAQAAPNPPAKP